MKSSVGHIKENNEEVTSFLHDSEGRIQTFQQLGEENSKNSDSEECQEENSKNSDFEEAKEYHQTDGIHQDTLAQPPENNVQNNESQTPKNSVKKLNKLTVGEKQRIESDVLTPNLNSSDTSSSDEIVSTSDSPKLSVSEEPLIPMISQIIKRELENVKGTTARHHLERTLAHFEQKSKNTTTLRQVGNEQVEAQLAAKTNIDVVTTFVENPSEVIPKLQVKKNSPNEETNSPPKDADRDGLRKHIPRPPKESVCFPPYMPYISDDSETIDKSTFSKDIKATSSPAQNQIQNGKFYRYHCT